MSRLALKFLFGSILFLGIIALSMVIKSSSTRTLWSNAPVTSLMWSPDGRTLAIGSADGLIMLWDITMNKPRQSIAVPSKVVSLAWSPDSRIIASGTSSENDDDSITLWDIDSGESIQNMGVPATRLRALSWSPNGLMLSAGLQENTIIFWDINNDNVQQVGNLTDGVLNLAFSPDGHLLAVAQQDGFVTFVDSANHEPVRRVTYSQSAYVADIAWSPDGETLASASCSAMADLPANCSLVLWDLHNGGYTRSFQGGDYDFTSVAWSPSGRFIASAFLNGDVILYRPDTGRRVRTFRTPVGSTIVAWAPDGQTLAAGSEDGSVLLWTIH